MRALRRALGVAGLSVLLGAGFLAMGEQPARAAGPWFVNNATGVDNGTCGTAGSPCKNVNFLLTRAAPPAGVVQPGDTVNVVAAATPHLERVVVTKAITLTGIAGPGGPTPTINAAAAVNNGGTALTVQAPSAAAAVNLNNLRLTGGFRNFGGGLLVTQGAVTASNLTVTGNTAATTTVPNAAGSGGGGIAVAGKVLGGDPSLVLSNSIVAGNFTGTVGMATASLPGAGIYSAGPITVSGSIVENNVIRPSTTPAQLATGDGGGMYLNKLLATDNATGIVHASTFRGNSATDAGGGISVHNTAGTGASLTVRNGSQIGEAAGVGNSGRVGGGIHFNGTTLVVNDSTVAKNTAAGANSPQGGGIFLNTGTATTNNATVTGNSAANIGGGVVVNAHTSYTANGGSISSNTGFWGGGMAVVGRVLANLNPGAATLHGVQLVGNTAGDGVAASSGNGGGVFNNGTLVADQGTTFSGNRARAASGGGHTGYGGAIWNGPFLNLDAPTTSLTDVTIAGANAPGGNANIGGAIASTGRFLSAAFAQHTGTQPGVLTLTRTIVVQNVAAAAGGIYAAGPTTLTDSAVSQNFATHPSFGFGGGIWASTSPVTDPAFTLGISGSAVNSNSAVTGAGMAIGPTVTANVVDASEIDDNTGTSGGGVYLNGTLNVSGSSVSGNDAGFLGGGVLADDPDSDSVTYTPVVNLADADVIGNTAVVGGGGLVIDTNGSLAATAGEISSNSAASGGAVFVGNGVPATFASTDLRNNTANGGIGGAVLSAGSVSIADANITGNRAVPDPDNVNTGLGGAIYSGTTANGVNVQLSVARSTFSANEARRGSVLVNGSSGNGTNKTSIDRSTLTGNVASDFGAIWQTGALSIASSTIADNLAPNISGGLVLFATAVTNISGSIVAGNSVANCANLSGTPVDGGYNLTDAGDTSCGFSPAENDVFAPHGLGALADNGGPTLTRMPLATSAALDVIPPNTATGASDAVTGAAIVLCPAGGVDQRGVARPIGPRCEIGATETDYAAPTIDGPTSATYTVGTAGAQLDYTTTGTPVPTLSVAGDPLPAGVSFTDNGDGTGKITGTPLDGAGGVYVVDIVASNGVDPNASIELTLTVNEAPEIDGPVADTYTVGQAGGPTNFSADGHPTSVFSIISGALPAAVTLTDNGDGTASIGGTPAAGTGGVHNVTLQADNGTTPPATHPFALTVREQAGLQGPATATFTVGSNGSSGTYTASGYPVPTIDTTSPLPGGLAIQQTGNTAVITGTPPDGSGGFYPGVVVRATNGVGEPAAVVTDITINEAPEIAGAAVVRVVTGTASNTLYSTTGFPEATLSATGTLPTGITFTDNGDGTGTLAATAGVTQVGTYEITITATNGIGDDATLDVTIQVVPPVTITTTSLPDGSVGAFYSQPVVAEGGQPPYTFSIVGGALPAGLTLNPATGVISGTPTGPATTSNFTVQVADALDPAQTATKALSITIGRGATTLTVQPVLLRLGPLGLNLALVESTLKGPGGQGIPGQTIVYRAGGTVVCTGVTDANGYNGCSLNVLGVLLTTLNLGVTAQYAGNALWQPASGSAGLIG